MREPAFLRPSLRPWSGGHALTAALFLLFLTAPAFARLGESPRQCQKIYGKPVGSTVIPGLIPNGIEYHRGEYSVICGFEENRCTIVVVVRLSPTEPTANEIYREDMELFMMDNFGQTNWFYTRFDHHGKLWKTYDWERNRSYLANYSSALEMLTLRMEEG